MELVGVTPRAHLWSHGQVAEADQLPADDLETGSTVDSFLRKVARAPEVSPLPVPGQVVGGKYRIERLLGAGAMGAVFAARHELLQQTVALKVMLPEVAASKTAAARFLNEARAAARIEGEHVARVLDVGHLENDVPFIALELLEGADLARVLAERGCFSQSDALLYVLQALEAVAQAHALGVIHRDLKPANLFLARRRDGTQIVKVLDFGISKALNVHAEASLSALTHSSSMLGSPLYMSPEQVRNSRDVDPRADVWAVGVILFELLTGKAPFNAQSVNQVLVQILEQEPLSLRSFRADLPEPLEQVILRCLSKDAGRRFGDVASLALALMPFASLEARPLVDRIQRIIAARSPSVPPEHVSALAVTDPSPARMPAPHPASEMVNSVGLMRSAGLSTTVFILIAAGFGYAAWLIVGLGVPVNGRRAAAESQAPSAMTPSPLRTSKPTAESAIGSAIPTASASASTTPLPPPVVGTVQRRVARPND
ncbi:MAG TPA: serine/threonine-protein kinase [Polyangiaceae bacterium]